MTTSRAKGRVETQRIRPWRRTAEVAQAVLLLGLPFLRVGGESALRFDLASLRLHLFGATLWMDELFGVLAAALFVTFLFLLLTLLFGRLWCGWGCPQTALSDLTAPLDRARRRGGWRAAATYVAFAVLAAVASANLIWYFVPPQEFVRRAATFSLGPVTGGIWFALGVVLFADLAFWRQGFCATTCPYAKLQGALLDRHSMVIAYDPRRDADCTGCKACVRACPVGIDIRDGLQAACTSCGECIDACAPIMARLGRRPKLVGYFFGEPGTARRLLRPGAVALGVLTAGSLALTVAVAADRSPLEMTITAAGDVAPRRLPTGESWHGFTVAFENRGRDPLALSLALAAPGVEAQLKPDAVLLQPGEHRRVRVTAVARGISGRPVRCELTAVGIGGAVRADRVVSLSPPERR